MADNKRPISPHLQIYRPQLTSVTSILHRVSGIFLSVGLLALVWWLCAIASGRDAYVAVQSAGGSMLGQFLLFSWTAAFFYHLLNGIRHLAWDAGWGFDLPVAYRTGWAALLGAGVLTVISWAIAYAMRAA